jgi:hypothetical protein
VNDSDDEDKICNNNERDQESFSFTSRFTVGDKDHMKEDSKSQSVREILGLFNRDFELDELRSLSQLFTDKETSKPIAENLPLMRNESSNQNLAATDSSKPRRMNLVIMDTEKTGSFSFSQIERVGPSNQREREVNFTAYCNSLKKK